MTLIRGQTRHDKLRNLSKIGMFLLLGVCTLLTWKQWHKSAASVSNSMYAGMQPPSPTGYTASLRQAGKSNKKDPEQPAMYIARTVRCYFNVENVEEEETSSKAPLSDDESLRIALEEGNTETATDILHRHRNLELPDSPKIRKALEGEEELRWNWWWLNPFSKKFQWPVETGFWIKSIAYSLFYATWPSNLFINLAVGWIFPTDNTYLQAFQKLTANKWVLYIIGALLQWIFGQNIYSCFDKVRAWHQIIDNQWNSLINPFMAIILSVLQIAIPFAGLMWYCAYKYRQENLTPSIALLILHSPKLKEDEREKLLKQAVDIMQNHDIPFDRMGTLTVIPENKYEKLFPTSQLKTENEERDKQYEEQRINLYQYWVGTLQTLFLYQGIPYFYNEIGEGKMKVNLLHLAYLQQDKNEALDIVKPYTSKCADIAGTITRYEPLPKPEGALETREELQEAFKNVSCVQILYGFVKTYLTKPKKYSVRPDMLDNPFISY